jgi:hypothetical protein
VHHIEQGPQCLLRRTFVGSDHDLGGEDVHGVSCRHSGRGDPIEISDGQQINIVVPLVGGDQRIRCRLESTVIQRNPSATTVTSNASTIAGKATCPRRRGTADSTTGSISPSASSQE